MFGYPRSQKILLDLKDFKMIRINTIFSTCLLHEGRWTQVNVVEGLTNMLQSCLFSFQNIRNARHIFVNNPAQKLDHLDELQLQVIFWRREKFPQKFELSEINWMQLKNDPELCCQFKVEFHLKIRNWHIVQQSSS